MANIFRKKDSYIDRVNRSTFDLSFVNNLTMKFGAITPVCVLPASFGDSFQINARFNLQLLPTVFPIQTQLYARLHFVYVRTRTLWKDWMQFFGGDETVTPPFIQVSGDDASGTPYFNMADMQTGTLADYLGVPTTITGTYGSEINGISRTPFYSANKVSPYGTLVYTHLGDGEGYATLSSIAKSAGNLISDVLKEKAPYTPYYYGSPTAINAIQYDFSGVQTTSTPVIRINLTKIPEFKNLVLKNRVCYLICADGGSTISKSSMVLSSELVGDFVEIRATLDSSVDSFTFYLVFEYPKDRESTNDGLTAVYVTPKGGYWYGFLEKYLDVLSNIPVSAVMSSNEWRVPVKENCPFYSDDWTQLPSIPLSALPFRAYEAYYNAFGRDIRNNPFLVDNKPEYNRYVPSLDGGGDTYPYRLHYANWEPDAYTTALQSPQAGVAPLVGITSLGEATFRDAAGTEYHAQLETAEDGDTVTGFQVKSSNAPADVVRNLIGMATSGISISDFRNVNSLQRFLEIRVRQSPRYKNLVKGLFDVNLDYDELMMPEFLGGISDTIPVYKVTQTTPTEGNPLGSFAGQGSLQSGMRHVIRKYCPEDGYILGVMSVVPAANYSQLLPPHFTRMSLLDWHFPQFNNISYQPMLYKHLCPYQAYALNPANVNNVFGYQRAYWDLISSFDEVHGEFRGSMRNFLINRVFDKAPELSQDFLLVNPDHVNDVFAMTSENGDKILGSIAFDITKKTTISRNSIPHIE